MKKEKKKKKRYATRNIYIYACSFVQVLVCALNPFYLGWECVKSNNLPSRKDRDRDRDRERERE